MSYNEQFISIALLALYVFFINSCCNLTLTSYPLISTLLVFALPVMTILCVLQFVS